MDEGHGANVQGGLVHRLRTWAVALQCLRNDPQEDARHHVQSCHVTLHEVAQPLWNGEQPLAHRQAGEDVVGEVRRLLHHAPCVSRGADATAFAGIGHEVVVAAVITPGLRKTMRKGAALQIFAESLTGIGLGGVAVALAVELTRAGEFMPSLEVFGNGLVQQRALRVAWVVELGLGTRLLRMRVGLR